MNIFIQCKGVNKYNMARRTKKHWLEWAMWIIAVVTSLAIGGSFIAGKFTDVVILNYLPLIVHQIVGWASIILTIWGAVFKLFFR